MTRKSLFPISWFVISWRTGLLLGLFLLVPAHGTRGEEAGAPTYEEDIRPILKANCFHCHGEEQELAGSLDLRMRRTLVSGGDSGEAVTPGDHEASLLFEYVASGEMPPEEAQKLSGQEVALISKWIDAGAPTLRPEPEITPVPGEFLITEDERRHWAFRPIVKPETPVGGPSNVLAVAAANAPASFSRAANPIDAFVGHKLQKNGLHFSPEADRATLIRRATFDLLGLPPTPEEVDDFLNDDSPNAYERLIDRLLDSPHYGERWARHWLDVAGYADSEGYNDNDDERPDAWRYRDYVIQAFNSDKPWDQFLVEQLAGDELVGATPANVRELANRDAETCEKLTATGFLRMAPDGTGSKPSDPQLARNQVVTETIKIVSSSLLGITVGCAECHDHRFDPIPQEDFYRLRAVFAPVYDTDQWRVPAARRVALLSTAASEKAAELEARAKQLDAQHDAAKQEVLETVLQRVLEDIPADERELAREAFETPAAERSSEQKQIVADRYPMLGLLKPGRLHLFLARFEDGGELMKKYEDFQAEAAKLRAQKPTPDYIRVATEDPKHVPETHVFYRGDHSSPQSEVIPPGGLSVLARTANSPSETGSSAIANSNTFASDDAELPTTGRRLALARNLTDGSHPLAARVLVNRFWLHHFGQGLVASTGDFGKRSNGPSHPELLDWLAADFMDNGWRLKRLHKLIMTSRTYRQASLRRAEAEEIDADNRLLWRMPVRRLEAEAVRDAILAVNGRLNRELYGAPVAIATNEGGIVTVNNDGRSDNRPFKRTIYIQVRRSQPVAFLQTFDSPEMEPNCEQRVSSTVATQSLAMLNGTFILEQSEAMADRVLAETGSGELPQQVERAWRLAMGETIDGSQLESLTRFLQQQTDDFRAREVPKAEQQALASLCQVLFSSNRFLYVN